MLLGKNSKLDYKKQRKKGRLRYATKEYSNPFFAQQKKKKLKHNINPLSLRVKVIIVLILFIIVSIIWFLLYSNYFEIKNIRIEGGAKIAPEEIEEIVRDQINNSLLVIYPQKNIFLFSKNKLITNLEQKYCFDQLTIKKKLPNSLYINYKEKEYSLIWYENDYFYADEMGDIISEVGLDEVLEKKYPIIENRSSQHIKDKLITVDNSYVYYILSLDQEMKKHSEEFRVDRYILDNELDTVKMKLMNGPLIYFNIKENIQKQIEKMIITKNKKLNEEFNNKIYIDVRYGDSVYYR